MKVQNEMSTRISVNTVSAVNSMKAFRDAIRATGDSWRAQEQALRNSGQYSEAAKARFSGLNQVIDLQKAKISELQARQDGLNMSNKKQASQFLKLERQIQQANRQLASYESQATRARNAVRYQVSGLAALQKAYRQSQSASAAYIARLEAEGKSSDATVAKQRSLKQSLTNLESQYRKQEFLLRQLANETGRDSDAYVKQRTQLNQTATAIANTRNQLRSLKESTHQQRQEELLRASGLQQLQQRIRLNNSVSQSYVSSLRAQGNAVKADQAELKGLQSSLVDLRKEQAKQEFLLSQTEHQLGKNSEAYKKQQVELNQTTTAIARTETRMNELKEALNPPKVSGWQIVRENILGVSKAEENARQKALNFGSALRANILGGWVQQGFSALVGEMKSVVVTGMQVNQVGQAMQARWANIGVGSRGIKQLSDQVSELKTNTNLSAQAVNALQTRFYGMTHSVSQTKVLTQGVASLSDQLKLSEQQAEAFSGGLSRIESSGKVTSSSLGRLEKQAPGLSTALVKASGMSQKSFKDLVASGKMTSDQFNQILANASKNYDQNAKAFGQSSTGALHKLQQEWITTQGQLAKPLVKVAATGLNELSAALNNKDTQRGLQELAKGMATAAVDAAKLIGYLAKHQTTVKIFAGTIVTLVGAFKGMQIVLMVNDTLKGFMKMMSQTKMVAGFSKAIDGLRSGISKLKPKKVNITADTTKANNNVKETQRNLDKMPKEKTTKVNVDSKSATKGVQATNKELDKIPKAKTSRVNVDTKAAQTNVKAMGTASKAAATTSKISFASIRTAGVTSIKAIGLAVRANPLGALLTGLQLATAAFDLLYKHSKTFRTMMNGLKSATLSGLGKIGGWFSKTFNGIGKTMSRSARQQQKISQQNTRIQQRQAQQMNRSISRTWSNMTRSISRGWTNFWRGVGRGTTNGWRKLTRAGENGRRAAERSWNTMSRNVGRVSNNMWRGITRSVTSGWRNFVRSTQNGTRNVETWFGRMETNTGRTVQQMARQHPRTFQLMYKSIEDRSKLWHDLTTGHWNRLENDTINIGKDMSNESRSLFSDMYDKLNSITGGRLGDMLNAVKNHFSKVISTIQSAAGNVHNAFMGVLRGIATPFSAIINGVAKGINWIADKVGGTHIGEGFALSGFAKGTPHGGILHDQIALLNDGEGPHYQEMIHKRRTGKTYMLPPKRNIIMPLEQGDEVLDGENSARLAKAMRQAIPHADGAIGNFFSGIFDKAKDALDDSMEWVDKAMKNVVEFGTELFHHFVESMPGAKDNGHEFSQMLHLHLPSYFAKIASAWLKKQLKQLNVDNPPGTGVARWRPVILRAFAALHVDPAEWKVNKLLRQIDTESHGDPHIWQQVHDKNSGGNEARGLLQFAGSTWTADALPGHTDWRSGYNEILAAINVLEHGGEGGWGNVGNGHGWANGGLVTQHGVYEVAEGNNPEMIIPLDMSKRGRAYSLLAQVISQFKSEDAPSANGSTDPQIQAISKKFDAVLSQNQQLIGLLDKLIGVTDSANNPAARYKRTQRDINLAQAQSFI